eukprot:6591341-Alexandrium_andersonii.AAC.1
MAQAGAPNGPLAHSPGPRMARDPPAPTAAASPSPGRNRPDQLATPPGWSSPSSATVGAGRVAPS